MKKLFFLIIILFSNGLKSQSKVIDYEWFSLGGGFIHSVEDEYLGLNGKINLIMDYDFHRYRFYFDYMYMPEIFSNHIGVGIAMLFFEDDVYRRKYMQRKHMNSKKRKSSRKHKSHRKKTLRQKKLNKS